ncbi:MAG TPA: hypothetical protein VKZ50_12300 [bacterium]|nr:hypothetical protein [bacterium]
MVWRVRKVVRHRNVVDRAVGIIMGTTFAPTLPRVGFANTFVSLRSRLTIRCGAQRGAATGSV